MQCPRMLRVEMSQGKAQGGLICDLGSCLGFLCDHRGGTVTYVPHTGTQVNKRLMHTHVCTHTMPQVPVRVHVPVPDARQHTCNTHVSSRREFRAVALSG